MLDAAVANFLGIDHTAYRCLDVIDQEGPMTAGLLAQRARLSPGATTAVIDRLEQRGLVRRVRDAEDRRRVLVEVRPDVRKDAEQLYGTPEEGAKAFDIYSDKQLEFLIGFLRGSVAFQEERMRRLEELKARNAGR
jgi:DNA-binding MarR family transcriptional regulator